MRKEFVLAMLLLLAGCGRSFEWFPQEDTKAPVVTAFVYHTESGSLTATIERFSATDNVAVSGYLVSESSAPPSSTDSGWTSAPPSSHALASAESKTLYAWARDAAGNVSTVKGFTPAYSLQKKVAFPSGVGWVADIAFDRGSSTFWLLAGTSGPPPNALVKIDANGQKLATVDGVSWPFYIGGAKAGEAGETSSLAYDGRNFWISSAGYDNSGPVPVPKSEIYLILADGSYYATYPCPATSEGKGFCQGLVWDGTSIWATASDKRNLVSFHLLPDATLSIGTPSADIWGSDGVSDMGFDSTSGRLMVLKDGLLKVDSLTLSLSGSRSFTLPGSGKGDWDGSLFWVVDNVSKMLLGLSFP